MTSASTLDFDELNKLGVKVKKSPPTPLAIPYRQYFGEMYISPEQMRSRISLAEEIEDVMLYVFAYWIIAEEADLSIAEVKQDAEQKLTSVVAKHMKLDPYLEKHIKDVIDEVVDVTARHTQNNVDDTNTDTDTGYWTSTDRAMLIAENEANAFDNYNDYREAKAQGKTKKTWITEGDDKVRLTHSLEEEKTIDIDGLFFVGNSQMRFPRDAEFDPEPQEVVNCRCACEYS